MAKLSLKTAIQFIDQAVGMEELKAYRIQITEMLKDHPLVADPQQFNDKVNDLHDMIMIKTVKLAEESLSQEGFGEPPVPYALILFGSGGRREQTLWSDQDNGLIYAEPELKESLEAVEEYFTRLGERITSWLANAGYPLCEGGVTCNFSRWNKSLSAWKGMLREWQESPTWESVRYLLIVADMRFLIGNESLAHDLFHTFSEIASSPDMLQRMLENTLRRKPALGLFGHLITERYGEDTGKFDVKYGLYIPFASGIRLLAIQNKIYETSTRGRIEQLQKKSDIEPEFLLDWLRNFTNALYFRALAVFRDSGEYGPTPMLAINKLNQANKNEIKRALRSVKQLQKVAIQKVKLHPEIAFPIRRDES
ncbi:MAG: hypothetical protein H7X86_06135 [Gorillibacterium sp.]|nr:hypothetical protein [Gorillibacterium sp.]